MVGQTLRKLNRVTEEQRRAQQLWRRMPEVWGLGSTLGWDTRDRITGSSIWEFFHLRTEPGTPVLRVVMAAASLEGQTG